MPKRFILWAVALMCMLPVAFGSAVVVPKQTVSSLGSSWLRDYAMGTGECDGERRVVDARLQGRHGGVANVQKKETIFFKEDVGGRVRKFTALEWFNERAPLHERDFLWMKQPLGWRRDQWNRDRCIGWVFTLLLRYADSYEPHRPVDGETLKPDGYMSVDDMMSFRMLRALQVDQEDMD